MTVIWEQAKNDPVKCFFTKKRPDFLKGGMGLKTKYSKVFSSIDKVSYLKKRKISKVSEFLEDTYFLSIIKKNKVTMKKIDKFIYNYLYENCLKDKPNEENYNFIKKEYCCWYSKKNGNWIVVKEYILKSNLKYYLLCPCNIYAEKHIKQNYDYNRVTFELEFEEKLIRSLGK